jgi:hypothetical protein
MVCPFWLMVAGSGGDGTKAQESVLQEFLPQVLGEKALA